MLHPKLEIQQKGGRDDRKKKFSGSFLSREKRKKKAWSFVALCSRTVTAICVEGGVKGGGRRFGTGGIPPLNAGNGRQRIPEGIYYFKNTVCGANNAQRSFPYIHFVIFPCPPLLINQILFLRYGSSHVSSGANIALF